MFEEDQTGNDNKVELRDINKNGINRALLE